MIVYEVCRFHMRNLILCELGDQAASHLELVYIIIGYDLDGSTLYWII